MKMLLYTPLSFLILFLIYNTRYDQWIRIAQGGATEEGVRRVAKVQRVEGVGRVKRVVTIVTGVTIGKHLCKLVDAV